MGKNPEGRLAFTSVTLHPKTVFSGAGRPNEEALRSLHGAAHRECFIANSVRCEVTIEPEFC
jgi:organic hydroperoxide reductase OsmC/OhrA